MARFGTSLARLAAPAAAASLLLGTLPAFAQTTTPSSSASADCSTIHFELANPTPGSMLEPGAFVIEGIARDTRATSGPGIDHIDFFLDNRDEGGINVGSALPGATAGPFGPGSFQATVTLPDLTGGHDLFGYAHSSVTGQETVVAVPVAIGEDPAVAGETSASGAVPTVMASCPPATTSPSGGTTTTTPSTTPPATTAPTNTTAPTTMATGSSSSASIVLDVANPTPESTILVGAYTIQGLAVDRSARQGNGVDRIDIFLDNRDEGGLFLGGTAPGSDNMFHALVDLPDNQRGLHTLFFYAHSTVSGREKVVEIPVTIE